MKIVQGVQRQYQLVEKTKKKDLDGVVYLVAGERNLWVKLLKDKSPAKREQIARMIGQGGFAGFEKPLEIVNDAKGAFAGYTFRGQEMEIVPEKNLNKQKERKKPPVNGPGGGPGIGPGSGPGGAPGFPGAGPVNVQNVRPAKPPRESNGAVKWLILLILGVGMFVLLKLVLDTLLLAFIYNHISQTAALGCHQFTFGGILPGVVGIAGMLWFQKAFGSGMDFLPAYGLMAVLFFIGGSLLAYAVIGVICALVIGIFGMVQTYQTVIVGVLILAFLVKILLPSKK